MAGERWIFTRAQLANTPTRKCGQSSDKELNWRQQAANLIQDMGQKLQVTQLCINTAIVFMHRFYMIQSFTKFHRNTLATASLFLAAKVEEQPRKLEHVLKASHACLRRDQEPLDVKSTLYLELAQELVVNENILLQTLGFETTVEHPHTYVVRTCTLVRASKDLAQTSYFLATNSLHLTSMCLEHQPTVVACVCIHLACKWANWEIPKSSEGKEWYWYVDKNVTLELLEELTQDFLAILDKCPSKLKKKLMNTKNLDEGLFAHLGNTSGVKVPSAPGTKVQSVTPGRPQQRTQQRPGGKKPPAPSTVTSATAGMTSPPPLGQPPPDNKQRDGAAMRQLSHQPGPHQRPPAGGLHPRDQHGHSQLPPDGSTKTTTTPVQPDKVESNLRRVRTEPTLTPHEYFERKERERLEGKRIEKERQKLAAEREKARLAQAQARQGPPGGERRDPSKVKPQPHQHRQHTNIFDEMREVRKPEESRKPELSSRDRPEHGALSGVQQQRSADRPPLHKASSVPPQPPPVKQEPSVSVKPEPSLAPSLPHSDSILPLLGDKPLLGQLPPLLPLDIDSSPMSDNGELTSQVELLIQRSLMETSQPPPPSKSPLITIDDLVDSSHDHADNSERKPPVKSHETVVKPVVKQEPSQNFTPQGPVQPYVEQIKTEQTVKSESRHHTPDSERQSLKIKLDLKAASGHKHETSEKQRHEKSERHRHDRHEKHRRRHHKERHHHHHRHDSKEKKLKIKPPVPPVEEEEDPSKPREKLKLKFNLKNMTTSSPVAGTSSEAAVAELEPGEIQDDEEEEGEYQANSSPNPMKLVLSKSLTGHYRSREHRHRHSSSGSGSHHHRRSSSGERTRSRKRAHSPSDSSRAQATSKMSRPEHLRANASNHEGASNGGKSASPLLGSRHSLPSTPSSGDLKDLGIQLKRVIEMQAAQMASTAQPPLPGAAVPPPPPGPPPQ